MEWKFQSWSTSSIGQLSKQLLCKESSDMIYQKRGKEGIRIGEIVLFSL